MISVVMATLNDGRILGRALGALVPAAVDGLVREVILADGGSSDETLQIAEDAGARVVSIPGPAEARLVAGCAAARSEWLLIMPAPRTPPEGWERAAIAHLKDGPQMAAYWGRTAPWPLPRRADALLISRRLYDLSGGFGDGLLRRLGRKARPLRIGR